MKKYIAVLVLIFTLTACHTNELQSNEPLESEMQNAPTPSAIDNNTTTSSDDTTTDSITSNNDTIVTDDTVNTTTVNATIDLATVPAITAETIENYYKDVGEEKAIEADIKKLELDFKKKLIQSDAFQTQKTALKTQENALESQIELLEDRITINLPENWVDTTNMEQMIQKLQEVEIAEKQMEISIKQAEQEYINNNITREDYIQKVIELEKQKDVLDKQEDILEQTLESLGWDD